MESILEIIPGILSFSILGWILLGVVLGIIFGGTPGISTSMGIAFMLPLTFTLPLIPSIALILGLYVGGTSGGLITAILINIPGTTAAIATCWDGHPMAQRGEAGKALGIGIFYSFCGGIISFLLLITLSPIIARFALKFGAVEYFSISLFSLALISTLSGKSLAKGVAAAMFGMAFTTVGAAPLDGNMRFTFGSHALEAGFKMLPVLVGTYAVSEVLKVAERNAPLPPATKYKMRGFGVSMKEFREQFINMMRSALIGTGIGLLPGLGANISNILSYTVAKQQSRYPEKFGTGIIDGIVASETANNAVTGGALIPLLTVGIPGDAITAMLLSAIMVQGITPGPLMFKNHIDIVYAVFIAIFIANALMIIVEYFGLSLFLKILLIPNYILLPIVLVMCTIGAYATNNRVFDVWSIIVFAIIGYGMQKFKYPISPFVLGYILGNLVETNLRRAFMVTRGSFVAFLERPIAAVFFIITIVFVGLMVRSRGKNKNMASED
ncbi:MAG: tripartite tricarboxylate transporter permease [Spirochaetales bacterium]|nr:tripartite tricarboxylate transporter permease [Spirochaetales bacterium]